MKCKSKFCDLESGHKGRCMRLTAETATNNVATNTPAAPNSEISLIPLGEDHSSGRTRNRRAREAYNAYQREYMRKRRA